MTSALCTFSRLSHTCLRCRGLMIPPGQGSTITWLLWHPLSCSSSLANPMYSVHLSNIKRKLIMFALWQFWWLRSISYWIILSYVCLNYVCCIAQLLARLRPPSTFKNQTQACSTPESTSWSKWLLWMSFHLFPCCSSHHFPAQWPFKPLGDTHCCQGSSVGREKISDIPRPCLVCYSMRPARPAAI